MFYVVYIFLLFVTLSGLDDYDRYNTDICATMHGSKLFERYNDATGYTELKRKKQGDSVEWKKREMERREAEEREWIEAQQRERARKQNEKKQKEIKKKIESEKKRKKIEKLRKKHVASRTKTTTGATYSDDGDNGLQQAEIEEEYLQEVGELPADQDEELQVDLDEELQADDDDFRTPLLGYVQQVERGHDSAQPLTRKKPQTQPQL